MYEEGLHAHVLCDARILGINLLMFAQTRSIKGWWLKNYVDLPRYREEQVANALRMIPFCDRAS